MSIADLGQAATLGFLLNPTNARLKVKNRLINICPDDMNLIIEADDHEGGFNLIQADERKMFNTEMRSVRGDGCTASRCNRFGVSKRSGFTLIEMLVVILVIGILSAYFGQSIFGQTNDAKLNVAKSVLDTKFPMALIGYHSISGYGGSKNICQRDLIPRGISPYTPWGSVWAVGGQTRTLANNRIYISYPTGPASVGEENARKISKFLNQKGNPMIIQSYPLKHQLVATNNCADSVNKHGAATGKAPWLVVVAYTMNP